MSNSTAPDASLVPGPVRRPLASRRLQGALLVLSAALLSGCTGGDGGGGVTPPDAAPQVSVSASPSRLVSPGTVTVTAQASDDKGVSEVRFVEGGAVIGTDREAPYSVTVNYTQAQAGEHLITAVAVDTAGQEAQATARVEVLPPPTYNYTPVPGFWNGQTTPGPWCAPARTASTPGIQALSLSAARVLSRTWNLQITPGMRQADQVSPEVTPQRTTNALLPLGDGSEAQFGQALERLKVALASDAALQGAALTDVRGWWVSLRVNLDQARSLQAQGLIQHAEPELQLRLAGLPPATDPTMENEVTYENMTDVGAAHAQLDLGCAHPVVAVIDSGWVTSTTGHEANLVPREAWFDAVLDVQGQAATSWVTPQGDHRHGAAVGGVIANVTHDGLPGSSLTYNLTKVLPINVMSGGEDGLPAGTMYSNNIEQAIQYATGTVMAGSRVWVNPYPAQVINLSLGSDSTDPTYLAHLESVAAKALDRGALIVAATGNQGTTPAFDYALAGNTIGVGAVDLRGQLADFSNRGPGTDVLAPGWYVPTLVDGQPTTWSGTSFAAPWFSGQLSLWNYANMHRTGSFTANLRGQELFKAAMACIASASRQPLRDPVTGHGLVSTAKLVSDNNAACALR